jgi:histidinol-phosphate aminotransferase
MYKLNKKAALLKPYEPLKGKYRIRLDANESFIPLDREIVNEIAEEIKKVEFNRYPDSLAENACAAFADYYGLDRQFVTAGNGSDELISVIINGLFERGDSIVITSPDFSMYRIYCGLAEINPVIYNKKEGVDISAEEIVETVKKSGAKGLIFSNPCNPTSKGLCEDDVKKIINSLPDTLIVLDEAYMDFDGGGLLKEAAGYDNLIVLKTCSKFGLAAIRLGFAVAGRTLTNALRAIKSPYNVNSLTAAAAAVVFKHKEYLKACVAKIISQREKLYNLLKDVKGIKVVNGVTNFVFVHTEKSKAIYESLLKKGIAVREMGGCLRITAGSDNENAALIKALTETLDNLNKNIDCYQEAL